MTQLGFNKESLNFHRKYKEEAEVVSKIEVNTTDDFSRVYSPGVAAPCLVISDCVMAQIENN